MTNYSIYICLVIVFTVLLTTCENQPKVLIIGDSISIGYTPFVENYFEDKVMISHNPGNAQHTGTGLEKIEEWLGEKAWDLIQFNWGLWDLCYRHPDSKVQGNRDKINGKITYPLNAYITNLDSIVSILKRKTDAKLVFITTTYIPNNEAGRFSRDAIRYNQAAIAVMKKHAIQVNDIYEQSVQIHEKFGKGSDDVHYTQKGYEELGKLVASFLAKELNG